MTGAALLPLRQPTIGGTRRRGGGIPARNRADHGDRIARPPRRMPCCL